MNNCPYCGTKLLGDYPGYCSKCNKDIYWDDFEKKCPLCNQRHKSHSEALSCQNSVVNALNPEALKMNQDLRTEAQDLFNKMHKYIGGF